MKTILQLLLISFILVQFSCSKDDVLDSESLRGLWVHTETKTDTIDFNTKTFTSKKTFELKRGKEMHNDYELPKTGSGLYTYEIEGDSIYLQNVMSSLGADSPYYFKLSPDNESFKIASFAPFTGGLMVNEFKRIDN